MKKHLNKLERAIISEIVKFNKKEYSSIELHIPYLNIKFREATGIGMYVHFEYSKEGGNFNIDNSEEICLSSNKQLELDNLEYGLNYELNITNGKFDFLELVTNGEDWDGSYEYFEFSNS